MTCSARSFGCSTSSASSRRSCSSLRPRRRVPAIGRLITRAVAQLHQRLRRRPHDRRLGMMQVVHVRRRVHEPQHAVHRERIDRLDEIEALRRARPGRCRPRGCAPWPLFTASVHASVAKLRRSSGSSSSSSGGRQARARTAAAGRDRRPRCRAARRAASYIASSVAASASGGGYTFSIRNSAGGSGRTRRRCPRASTPRRETRGRRAAASGSRSISRTVS